MTPTPSFDTELAAQMALARSQEVEARSRGDLAAAELAAGRLADLEELVSRCSPVHDLQPA